MGQGKGRRRREAARRRSSEFALRQEQLERRVALSVNIGGYADALDFYQSGTGTPVIGRAVIAGDQGDDIYIRQVASVTQDLLVSTDSSFSNYQVIDDIGISGAVDPVGIDGSYDQLFITNGTLRTSTDVVEQDFVAPGNVTRFILQRDDIQLVDLGNVQAPAGILSYVQSDGRVTSWDFDVQPAAGALITPLTPILAGDIRPVAIRADDVESESFSYFVEVTWSDSIRSTIDVVSADVTYWYNPPGVLGFQQVRENGVRPTIGDATRLTFTLPGARATGADGVVYFESLGLIPGTLRGRAGSISGIWSNGYAWSLPEFFADVVGTLRFRTQDGQSTQLVTAGNTATGSSFCWFSPGFGKFISINGSVTPDGVISLTFRKWDNLNNVGISFQDEEALPGVPGPVAIAMSDPANPSVPWVTYMTYTRDTEPMALTVFAGQTITREVTVDLLTPGSAINIDSPIEVAAGIDAGFDAGVGYDQRGRLTTDYPTGVDLGGDLDLRATNVNVRAPLSAPNRFNIGHSQVSRDRLSLPRDFNDAYLLTPSMPTLYATPDVVTAQAIAEVVSVGGVGVVSELVLLPGFQGAGYDPANPPTVTISAPGGAGGTQATAVAVVGPDGSLSGFIVTNRGSGYGANGIRPTVAIDAPTPAAGASAKVAEIQAATGGVVAIDVLDPGYRYHAPPVVEIAPPPPGGDSRQATGRAVLDASGRVVSIEVVDPGQGYVARPVVRLAAPSPVAYTETVSIRADVQADMYELYVADDFGTAQPRGLFSLTPEGQLSTTPTSISIAGLVGPPVNGQQVVTVTAPPPAGTFPATFNPVGRAISGTGITAGTRVLGFNRLTNQMILPAGSISSTLQFPVTARVASGAYSLYLEASTADVYMEGQVNAGLQSYLLESPESDAGLTPFVFTTASPVTGTPTGLLEGAVVDIGLGNDAPTPRSGGSAFNVVDLTTRVASLRTRAAESAANPTGAFPYDLTVRALGDISIDGLAASSRPISFLGQADIFFTAAVQTEGDLTVVARDDANDANYTVFRVTAPVATTRGAISIAADRVEVRNSLAVTGAAVAPGREDVRLEATRGDMVLQSEITAVNDVVLIQRDSGTVSGSIDGSLSRVISEGVVVDAEGKVSLRTAATQLTATAGTGFTLSELDDISIPLLSSGGLVSLTAMGVDPGKNNPNEVALSARLNDVGNLFVSTPNGTAIIDANTNKQLLLGDAANLYSQRTLATSMQAAGDVLIRSQASDIVALDAPIAGGSARLVRVATRAPLPVTTTYAPGIVGVVASTLSGEGSINALPPASGTAFWGVDEASRPIQLAVGDRVLVKDQPDRPGTVADDRRANGIYVVSKLGGGILGSTRWELVRPADADASQEARPGTLVRVLEGPLAGTMFAMDYDSVPRTLVERVTANKFQLPGLFADGALLRIGQAVTGTGIEGNAYISAIDMDAGLVTLDVVAPGQVFTQAPIGLVATQAAGANTLRFDQSFALFESLLPGQRVFGEGVLTNAVITDVDHVARTVTVTSGALPVAFGPSSLLSVTSSTASFVAPIGTVVNIGQRIVLRDGAGNPVATRTAAAVTPAAGNVFTISFTTAPLTTAQVAALTPLPVNASTVSGLEVSAVSFGAAPSVAVVAAVPAGEHVRLFLDPGFANYEGLRVGQAVFGPGVGAGATITAIDPVAGGIEVSAGFLPQQFAVTPRSNTLRVIQTDGATTGRISDVRVGQRVRLSRAGFGTEDRFVQDVNLQSGVVGLTVPLPAGWSNTVTAVEFLPVDAIQFGLGVPGAVPVAWNTWPAANDVAGRPDVLRVGSFEAYADLAVGQTISGPGIPAKTTISGFDRVARTITLSQAPLPGVVTSVNFGVGPTALVPSPDVLTLDASFTKYDSLYEGQEVFGAGIVPGAVITRIDRIARTISLTPGSVAVRWDNVPVAVSDDQSSPFYPEGFDDWVELDPTFNDFTELRVGQRVQFYDGSGLLLGSSNVSAVDGPYRTVGFADGALDGIAGLVESVSFLPVDSVSFGVFQGLGTGFVDFELPPVGLAPISFAETDVSTNIGTDALDKTATFVVSTAGRNNSTAGSLGKMMSAYQLNDVSEVVLDVNVTAIEVDGAGVATVHLDGLFTAYDRVEAAIGSPTGVSGTPFMFADKAKLLSVDAANGSIRLAADSLTAAARADLNRVQRVRLPAASLNPDQKLDFRFWTYAPGSVRLLQELPEISRAMAIDGARTSGIGAVAGFNPRYQGLFIDGQLINQTREGRAVAAFDKINGFDVAGADANGSRIARLSVGGFPSGSAIKIDSASNVVVQSTRVGLNQTNGRLPAQNGISIVGNASGSTILDSTVVGGTSTGIVIGGAAARTYVVGTSVGTPTVDNAVGIFAVSSDNFIGVDPILPAAPLVTTARLTNGSNALVVSRTLFDAPLIGLDITGAGIPAGTTITGIDTAAATILLSQTVSGSRTVNSAVTIGMIATRGYRFVPADDRFEPVLTLRASVPLDEVFVGQVVSGSGIPAGTVITAVDRANRVLTISQSPLSEGSGFISFGTPGRNTVQNNRRGIVLRGERNRVTNTDVINNTNGGIEVVKADGRQVIGTQVARGTAAGAGMIVASWSVTTNLTTQSRSLVLPGTYATAAEMEARGIRKGTPVVGPGIASGTTVAGLVAPTARVNRWTITLSQFPTATVSAASVGFGVSGAAGLLRWNPETAADAARLFVGQSLYGAGVPEYSQVTAIRRQGDANDYLMVSSPLSTLPAANRTFAAIAGGDRLSIASAGGSANAIYGNGRFGISLPTGYDADPATTARVERNRFGVTSTGAAASPNLLGNAVRIVGANLAETPAVHTPSRFERFDLLANQHGVSQQPTPDPTTTPPPPSPRPPVGPGRPTI